MKDIFKIKAFWVVFAVTTLVIFVAFFNLNETYVSRTEIMVIPRSAAAVQNSDQIISNLAILPDSLYFYNRLVEDDPALAVPQIQELPAVKKLAFWDSRLAVKRLGGSGVLEITAIDPNRARAESVSVQTARELIATAGIYYNVQTDIDLRIIDGPITTYAGLAPAYVIFLESLGGSFLLVSFAFLISFLLFGEQETPAPKKSIRWTFTGGKTFSPLPLVSEVISREVLGAKNIQREHPESRKSKIEPGALREEKKAVKLEPASTKAVEEVYTAFTKKAAAPPNLPVAEEKPVFSIPQSKDNGPVIISELKEAEREEEKNEVAKLPEEKPIIREATPEEVKERLNKLLSGKL